jgi:hypothetical protein
MGGCHTRQNNLPEDLAHPSTKDADYNVHLTDLTNLTDLTIGRTSFGGCASTPEPDRAVQAGSAGRSSRPSILPCRSAYRATATNVRGEREMPTRAEREVAGSAGWFRERSLVARFCAEMKKCRARSPSHPIEPGTRIFRIQPQTRTPHSSIPRTADNLARMKQFFPTGQDCLPEVGALWFASQASIPAVRPSPPDESPCREPSAAGHPTGGSFIELPCITKRSR